MGTAQQSSVYTITCIASTSMRLLLRIDLWLQFRSIKTCLSNCLSNVGLVYDIFGLFVKWLHAGRRPYHLL